MNSIPNDLPQIDGLDGRASAPVPGMVVFKDPKQPLKSRVRDLLSRMTLEEKAAQITQIDISVASAAAITGLSVGSVLNGCDSAPDGGASPEIWIDMVDRFQGWALDSRLGVPILYGTDAVHGHNNVHGATVFPHNVGLGATRDADLVKRIGEATALEVRATGIHWAFAPCVAVCRDPRWGRCYESYSEDADIVSELTSLVTGLQGAPPSGHPCGHPFVAGRLNVAACAKHYVGDGGTERGVNEGDTQCSFEELEGVHLKPYLRCLDQGVSTVMASYSSWNGVKMHSNRYLITDILKEKLGFKGIVVSDWEGLDRMSNPPGSDYRSCVSAAVNAGIDMVMVPQKYERFLEDLLSLLKSGEIPMARIDDAVERILRVKFLAGVFEHPFCDRSMLRFVGCKEHRELAREAVRKSLVLLKNGNDAGKPLFPLDRNAKRILVAGTHAHDIGYQCGGWTLSWRGRKGNITPGVTILDGIKQAVGDSTEVTYEEIPTEATFTAGGGEGFSFAVVAVGEVPYAETWGDRTDLGIPLGGTGIIDVVARRVPTVAVVVSGRPLVLEPDVLAKVEGVVAAWLPGSEGGAGIADVLFGDYDFSGLLPVTWFRSVDQLPLAGANNGVTGKNLTSGTNKYDPLYPLGYGLKTGQGRK